MALTADQAIDWTQDLDVFEQAIANTNWDTVSGLSAIMGGHKESSGAQNASIGFDVILAAGTWSVELMYLRNSDNGIISVQLDGVEQGTVNSYSSSASAGNRSTVSSISVAQTAKYRLSLVMATKHASSSGYTGEIQHVQLRRTA